MVQVLEHENGDHSEVFVETADRAGLLTTIVQTLKDLNVNVVAAEVSRCRVTTVLRQSSLAFSGATPTAERAIEVSVCFILTATAFSSTALKPQQPGSRHSGLFIAATLRFGLAQHVDTVYCGLPQVDTEGSRAIDKFYVTYHGEPLNPPMVQLVTNTLQYTLSLSDVEKEESY